ncbi:S24/S26 family peptidase [Nocardioides aequoreus]|uniref:S24/S26 family peptidase n=1 Tax=Nocardioides aequoreus TaxID=397278 RepID=UPI0004C30728|nr:S24/S26 family peptidase [Nocardioides aequoreus]
MSRRVRRTLANFGVVALLGAWFVTFAPTAFGGPAAYIEVQGHSMDGTYATGDLVVTREQDTYAVGDIVAFRAGQGQVIHRITGGDGEGGYTLQGDNNPDPDPWHPTDGDVVGAAWLHLEQKAWLLHLPREPWFAGLTAGLLTLLVLGWDARPRRGDAVRADGSAETDVEPLPAPPAPIVVPAQRRGDTAPGAVPPSTRRRLRAVEPGLRPAGDPSDDLPGGGR